MKSTRKLGAFLIAAALAMSLPLAAAAETDTVPRMPKGADNLIDLSNVTGDTNALNYRNDRLVFEGEDSDTVRSVAFQVGDISSEDEYVLSFWAKIPADMPSWVGFTIDTNDNGTTKQDISFQTNVIYLNQDGQGQAQCTNIKIPQGKDFRIELHVIPKDGRWMRHIYIDGQAVTNDWSGNSADMVLDAVKPVFRVSAKRMAFEMSSFRMYKVDKDATEFEADTQPVKGDTTSDTPSDNTNTGSDGSKAPAASDSGKPSSPATGSTLPMAAVGCLAMGSTALIFTRKKKGN